MYIYKVIQSIYIVYECVCVFVFHSLSWLARWTYGPEFWHEYIKFDSKLVWLAASPFM